MQVKVVKPFPYSKDGINEKHTEQDQVIEIRDDLVSGLRDEGYICNEMVDVKDAGASVENKMQDQIENKAPTQHQQSRKGRGRRG